MDVKLGIVIVDYHTVLQTIKYIKEQLIITELTNKIVIVLNDVKDKELELFKKELDCEIILEQKELNFQKDIFIIPSQENLGYSKGNNLGARFLVNTFDVHYLCICNNDLNFQGKDPFVPLISKLEEKEDVGVVGPKVIGFENEDQSPHKYISLFDKYLFRNILAPFINLFNKTSKYNAIVSNAKEGYYYRIMGCFILVKTKFFVDCGMFDENTFLFGEESILSERLLKIGKKCYFYPDVCIIHEHGKTINKFFKKRKILEQEFLSDQHYYTTYLGVGRISIIFARIYLRIFIILFYFKDKIKQLSAR